MTRIFTGDYSTGDFSQWTRVVTPVFPGSTRNGITHPSISDPASIIVDDPDGGFCARYEMQAGATDASNERSEAKGDAAVYVAADTTAWYAWSWKFDESYPTNRHGEGKWGTIFQWKSAKISPYGEDGVPVLSFGWAQSSAPTFSDYENGYVHLTYAPQSAPEVGIPGGGMVLKIPLALGQWQDFKARISLKKDATGTFQLWRNGVRQTFLATPGFAGGQTLTGQFIIGGTSPLLTGINLSQGIYRDPTCDFTEIVYHRGLRIADTEDSL
jgi:hypothetical protein